MTVKGVAPHQQRRSRGGSRHSPLVSAKGAAIAFVLPAPTKKGNSF
jgi:hypothetical protein